MEICLHIGAHRTGTTTFQRFMTRNGFADAAGREGVAFWGPMRTRRGLFAGLIRNPERVTPADRATAHRSIGRVKMQISRLARIGVTQLVVSDENMIGTMGNNMGAARLYGQIRPRLEVFAPAFAGHPLRITLSIRSYHTYWASSLAYRIKAGQQVPDSIFLDRLATQPRRWRDLICDLGHVFPGAQIMVLPFEGTIGDTQDQFEAVLGRAWPHALSDADQICNASPSPRDLAVILQERGDAANLSALHDMPDRYMPFHAGHIEKMRADYDQDIAWLLEGADGHATYMNPIGDTSDGICDTEGKSDDKYKERMGQAG